ncbi:MAG: F0F1 ATP synthase subunit delta [Alphaproteobacteria bacterium]|nr:F0F1 ATP synthase subunit delta [Alphaproteobacteria bacterium]
MQIDLFTLVAQILNLLILLFLLRKFLYLPVLKAVSARQKLIADEVENAENARKKAEAAEKKSLAEAKKLEAEKQSILEKAHDEAAVLAAHLKAQTEEEYRQKRQQFSERIIAEEESFDLAIKKAAAEYWTQFAHKALAQIADADLNAAAVTQLMRRIKELPADEQATYAAAFQAKQQIEIRTAFPLDDKLKAQLEEFLRKTWNLPKNIGFAYDVKPDLICGAQIAAAEQLVAWNFEEYMQEFRQNMHKSVAQLLNRGEK